MKKKLLLISVLMTFNLYAVECNENSFREGEAEVGKIHYLYDSTLHSINNQMNINTTHLNSEEYENRLNELEKQLSDLTKNHSDLFKARLLNQENLQRWKLLEKKCENESLSLAKKGRYDAETMAPLIRIQMSAIQNSINTQKEAIDTLKQVFIQSREKH